MQNGVSQMMIVSIEAAVKTGFPSPATDYHEERIDLTRELISRRQTTYLVDVGDDSMVDAFIPAHAFVLVDRTLVAKNGDIVRVLLNGTFVVRYLKRNDRKAWLVPANRKYREIELTPDTNFEIWGVVTWILINPKGHKKNVWQTLDHDGEVDLTKALIKRPLSSFIINSEGDSMLDAFIPRKARLIIDRSVEACNGDLILGVLNRDFTVKILKDLDNKRSLVPANVKYKEIEINNKTRFEIWGVISWIIINPKDTQCML